MPTDVKHSVFERIATYRNLGAVLGACVGPGPTPGSERFYQSYIYTGGAFELVAIDPDTGDAQVFPSTVPTEDGAWAVTVGPDGNVYVGTLPNAHLQRLDPQQGTFTDLGRPSDSEQYIWQLAVATDGKLYGCTYPSAKLVSYDPSTGQSADLGRMDETELYARQIAADDDGFVYVGIGTSKTQIVGYEVATGLHRPLLPERFQVTGIASVRRGADGRVYGQVGEQHFRLIGWEAAPVASEAVPAAESRNCLADGRFVEVVDREIQVHDPQSGSQTKQLLQYAGNNIRLYRLGWGPDGLLYGSSVLPAHFFRVQPATGGIEHLGRVGGGEVYSFLQDGDRLLAAVYSGLAPLMTYDPGRAFEPSAALEGNPLLVNYPRQDSGWRPVAMIHGPDHRIYLGATAGYGKLGGPLTVWDPTSNEVESFHHVVTDQSVSALAAVGTLIAGGTTVAGGGGSHPTQTEARLFLWDPGTREKLAEIVPVPGAGQITDLVALPNGRIFGIAGGDTLFLYDLDQHQVVHVARLPFRGVIYNGAVVGPDGKIWGLATEGVFAVDPSSYRVQLVAPGPEPITCGVALDGCSLYFGAGPSIYRYTLPS